MRKIKNNNGITMIVLVITIIVLAMIAAITINYSLTGANYSKEKQLLADLEAVHHAIYEQYEQYKTTGDASFIVGTKCSQKPDGDIVWEEGNQYWGESDVDKIYYTLTPEQLKKIGITNTEDTYIVNYYTGECYNSTVKITPENNKILYIK